MQRWPPADWYNKRKRFRRMNRGWVAVFEDDDEDLPEWLEPPRWEGGPASRNVGWWLLAMFASVGLIARQLVVTSRADSDPFTPDDTDFVLVAWLIDGVISGLVQTVVIVVPVALLVRWNRRRAESPTVRSTMRLRPLRQTANPSVPPLPKPSRLHELTKDVPYRMVATFAVIVVLSIAVGLLLRLAFNDGDDELSCDRIENIAALATATPPGPGVPAVAYEVDRAWAAAVASNRDAYMDATEKVKKDFYVSARNEALRGLEAEWERYANGARLDFVVSAGC